MIILCGDCAIIQLELKSSQRFLRNSKLVESLVAKSNIGVEDIVYEIGPGKGIITEQLAKRCRKVVAIELDRKLYKELVEKFRENSVVEIQFGDFLRYNLPKEEAYKVFSNIPFNITADIISKLTSINTSLLEAYLIVQKEAAERFAGRPYNKECQFSLFLKPFFRFKILHRFKQDDFHPKPHVEVVLLGITRRKYFLVKEKQR